MRVIFTSILGGFLEQNRDAGLAHYSRPIIDASLDLYYKTISDFLPTPSKCHYTFNLRDLSKVVQGILMVALPDLRNKDSLVYLWLNETFRVFRDRLIDAADRKKYSLLCHERLEEHLDMGWELEQFETVLFGDYESGSSENANRPYVKLSTDLNVLIPKLDAWLELYNADFAPMNLVFFGDCV
jgi:dynein heavy chain